MAVTECEREGYMGEEREGRTGAFNAANRTWQ